MGAQCSTIENCCQTPVGSKVALQGSTLLHRGQRIVDHPGCISTMYKVNRNPAGLLHKTRRFLTFKAKHIVTGQWRAAKEVKKSEVDQNAWGQDLELAGICDHPNVSRLFEHFRGGDSMCQVVELCLGQTLQAYCPAVRTQLPEETYSFILRQALSAVGHIHSHGHCHLEISPDDFMFTRVLPAKCPAVEDICLKLINFGQATKIVATPKDLKSVAKSYHTQGQAPEQIEIGAAVEAVRHDRADVWAIGAMTFFVLTGAWPLVSTAGVTPPDVMAGQAWRRYSYKAGYFVQQCLTMQPSKRPSAEDLLESSAWLIHAQNTYVTAMQQRAAGSLKGPKSAVNACELTPDAIVHSFKMMAALSRLERAAITVAVHRLPEDKTVHLRAIFMKLDRNGDGSLSVQELVKGLGKAFDTGGVSSDEELKSILEQLDTDGNCRIDYTEFIAALYACRQELRDEVCEAVFSIFDTDCNGRLTLEELQTLLGLEGDEKLTEDLKALDPNSDGVLDIEEFTQLLKGAGESPSAAKKGRRTQPKKMGFSPKNELMSPKRSDDIKSPPVDGGLANREPEPQKEDRQRASKKDKKVATSKVVTQTAGAVARTMKKAGTMLLNSMGSAEFEVEPNSSGSKQQSGSIVRAKVGKVADVVTKGAIYIKDSINDTVKVEKKKKKKKQRDEEEEED